MKTVVFFVVFFFSFVSVSFSQDTIFIKGFIVLDTTTYECDTCYVILDGQEILEKNFLSIFDEKINNCSEGEIVFLSINRFYKSGALLRAKESRFKKITTYYDGKLLSEKIKYKGG